MFRLRTVVTLLILALVSVAVTVGAQTTPVETKPLDVPYVPTKEADRRPDASDGQGKAG